MRPDLGRHRLAVRVRDLQAAVIIWRAVCIQSWRQNRTRHRMKIRVINPNTSVAMTARIGAAASAVAAAGTVIGAVNPSFGAPSIEDHHDDVWAAAGVIEQVRLGQSGGAGAFVIAWFGDPGLHPPP